MLWTYPYFAHCEGVKNIKNDVPVETGRQRIIRMYTLDEYGIMSPELQYITRSGTTAAVLSGFIGGLKYMRQARADFLRQNTASPFESDFLARRKLTDTMTMSSARGAVKYAFRYGSFTTLYLLTTMTAANYNNKITVWEHAASGALLASIVKINYGIKGICVAGALGGVLGLLAGGIIVGSMKITGINLEDIRYWQKNIYGMKIKNKD